MDNYSSNTREENGITLSNGSVSCDGKIEAFHGYRSGKGNRAKQ